MITAELCWRWRNDRGLKIYVPGREYEAPRLEEIAKRMDELYAELDSLDKEICILAGKVENENGSIASVDGK